MSKKLSNKVITGRLNRIWDVLSDLKADLQFADDETELDYSQISYISRIYDRLEQAQEMTQTAINSISTYK